MSALLAEMHPDRIAVCFRTVGADGLPDGLMDEPRFTARLADIVTRHHHLGGLEHGVSEADGMLAALTCEQLEGLAARTGVVLHARQFLQEIRGPVLAALAERFGPGALDDARRHASLAPEKARIDDLDVLEAEVSRDGTACLAAWIGSLPTSLQSRVRLKWPNDHAVPTTDDATILDRGPKILKNLAAAESRAA